MIINIRDLHKSFGLQRVLSGVNLDIASGEMLAVVGPSGTGKSVLLKIITGLMDADSGDVSVDGELMTSVASSADKLRICSRMGVLFQGAALFDSMTLLENAAFPLLYRSKEKRKRSLERAADVLSDVGLAGHELLLPGEVSIGMRKRVGIARALVTEPELILFDEPNTGLDPEMGQEIYDLIKETHQRWKFTGIVVSHEIPEVFQVCPRVVMLHNGKVQIDGSIEQFFCCEKSVVEQFVAGDVTGPIEMV